LIHISSGGGRDDDYGDTNVHDIDAQEEEEQHHPFVILSSSVSTPRTD